MIPSVAGISPLSNICFTSIASASALNLCATALAARVADSSLIRRRSLQPRTNNSYLSVRKYSGLRYVHPRYQRRTNQPAVLSITRNHTLVACNAHQPLISRAEFWHRACRRRRADYDDSSSSRKRCSENHHKLFEERQKVFREKLEKLRQKRVEMLKDIESQDMDWNKWSQWTKDSIKDMKKDWKSAKEELLKRRLVHDPYDTLFGWSNRLRQGLPPEIWIWGDVLQRKYENKSPEKVDQNVAPESQGTKFQSEQAPNTSAKIYNSPKRQPTPKSSTFPRSVPVEAEDSPNQPGSRNKDGVFTMPIPAVESHPRDYVLEYDPISHRMVKRSTEEFSHYGQDLDTSSNVPVDHSEQSVASDMKTETKRATSPEKIVRQEFEKWKAIRLPETVMDAVIETATEEAPIKSHEEQKKRQTISNSAQRAKLEDPFNQVHSATSNAQNIIIQTQHRNDQLRDLSDQMRALGDRISQLGPSSEARGESQKGGTNARTEVNQVTDMDKTSSNISPVSFRQLDYAKSSAKQMKVSQRNLETDIAVNPPRVDRMKTSKFRRRVEIEKLKDHIATLDRNFPGGHPPEALAHRQKLKNEIFRLKRDIEPIYSSRPWDQGKGETNDAKQLILEETRPSPPKQQAPPPYSSETVVYTILAYDPSTSEVSSTNISAPLGKTDERIPLTEALTRLSEPAKFLPHLRLLRDEGFIAVTATKNMLVLRGSAQRGQSSGVVAETGASGNVETSAESFPGGSKESAPPSTFSGPRPERLEAIYTGLERESYRTKERSKRGGKWFKRTLMTTGVAGAVLYVGGLNSGMRRVSVPPEPEKENIVIPRR